MKISFHTHPGGLDLAQGYGQAGFNVVTSLQKLGHKVPFNDQTAPVQLNFTQPYFYNAGPDQYNIGYTPWESTQLSPGWAETMNGTNEVWTTSDLMAQWFREDGVNVPVSVYEHGIDHIWAARRRGSTKKLRFLHIGEPAPRKCGQLTLDVFGELWGNNPDYSLTIKSNGFSTCRVYKGPGLLFTPEEGWNNVKVLTENISMEAMVSLYHSHDVLVYPSWGEGFGFIPLQAAATGMAVVMNKTWAPYRGLIGGPNITDHLTASPWPDVHPGKMLEPHKDSLALAMLQVAQDFHDYNDAAYEASPAIHAEYDWVKQTEKAFAPIVKQFG